jgi:hypothetical protein
VYGTTVFLVKLNTVALIPVLTALLKIVWELLGFTMDSVIDGFRQSMYEYGLFQSQYLSCDTAEAVSLIAMDLFTIVNWAMMVILGSFC